MGALERAAAAMTEGFEAALRRAQSPAGSFEAMLQELRTHLEGARRELVKALAVERQLDLRVRKLSDQASTWFARAELAVEAGDDEAARAALLLRRRLQGQLKDARQRVVQQAAIASEMKTAWRRMKQQLGDFAARKNTIVAQQELAQRGVLAGDRSAFEEFDAVESDIDELEDRLAAQQEVDRELGGGAADPRLQTRLLALEPGQEEAEDSAQRLGGALDVEDELQALRGKVRIGVKR